MKKYLQGRIKTAYDDLIDYTDYFTDEITNLLEDSDKEQLMVIQKDLEKLIEKFRITNLKIFTK